jgi:hypothetical protein
MENHMHWACLYTYSLVYVLLAVNVLMKLPLYDFVAVALYLMLAILSYLIHRQHT